MTILRALFATSALLLASSAYAQYIPVLVPVPVPVRPVPVPVAVPVAVPVVTAYPAYAPPLAPIPVRTFAVLVRYGTRGPYSVAGRYASLQYAEQIAIQYRYAGYTAYIQ